jgi:hypothetical protein
MKVPRFQFRLRTLMIVVTLFCISAAWFTEQGRIVHERREILAHEPVSLLDRSTDSNNRLSLVRRWLGDVDCREIGAEPVSDEELEHYRAVFPEATIKRWSDPPGSRIK